MVKSVLFSKTKDKSKEKDKEKEKELLSKKRQEPDTPPKDVDMVKLKKKINEIMCSICNPNNKENTNINYLYQSMHKNYLQNELTSNCLNYINKMIIDVKKNHLKKYQGIFELNKLFISIIKELLMNEFELLLLSLYLESIDISLYSDIFTFQESLIYLCYFIKKLTLSTEKLSPINSFLIRKYQGFEDKFNKWLQSNSSVLNNKLYFSYLEINQRFKEYNISYSIYCKNNYIDYNLIIDRILTMSIPYNEGKNDNLFVNKKENDLTFENNSNINTNSIKNESKSNINEIFFTTTNNKNNYNKSNNNNNSNINNINNLYTPNFIPTYPTGMFMNSHNNNNDNINLGYLYSGNNLFYNSIDKNNNKEIKFINKEIISIKPNESKNKTSFKVTNVNNINNANNENNANNVNINNINNNINNINKNTNTNEDQKINTINSKNLFIVEEDKKKDDNIINNEDNKNDSINNIKNNNLIKNQKIIEKGNNQNNQKVSITPNNLLYSLCTDNINNNTNQNSQTDNFNLLEKMYKQIKNDKNNNNNNINNLNNINNNNNIIKNIDGINLHPNNIIGFNPTQPLNDFNALKFNNNLGINDFNTPSQISFFSSKNPYFADISNLYHNSFHAIDQDENMKQLYQSNENFFRSCYSINSSKNFYPVINNISYPNNNIGESGNINNLNYPPIILGNPTLINLNNGLNNLNNGKNNIIQEKKIEENNNKNKDESK